MLRASLLLPIALLLALPGCYYSRRAADEDKNPVVDTGVGAAVIMPGQSAPAYPHNTAAPGGSSTSRVGPEGSSSSTSGGEVPSSVGNLTMIGGSEMDKERHISGKETPLAFKWLTAPLAVLAAPFAWAADKIRGEPEPGPQVPNTKVDRPEPERRAPPVDYETQRIQEMERELARRDPGTATSQAAPPSPARPSAGSASPTLSISDELAALQRAPRVPGRSGPAVAQPLETAAGGAPVPVRDEARVADGIVDRDGDGRIDLWIYREEGEVVRKALDQNHDGRPDTTLHYDRATHRLALVEEDDDFDGVTDSFSEYRDGKVVRRRADVDHDGQVDTWTFYRDGEIERREQDTTGDGFRDRIGAYSAGRLVREERDLDGDGRTDVTTHYDAAERVVRREEDVDRDGSVDVISHYENGHLARKELLGDPTRGTP